MDRNVWLIFLIVIVMLVVSKCFGSLKDEKFVSVPLAKQSLHLIDGAPCLYNNNCHSKNCRYYGDFGKCFTPKKDGSQCQTFDDCKSSTCRNYGGNINKCYTLKGPGGLCTTDGDCGSNYCDPRKTVKGGYRFCAEHP